MAAASAITSFHALVAQGSLSAVTAALDLEPSLASAQDDATGISPLMRAAEIGMLHHETGLRQGSRAGGGHSNTLQQPAPCSGGSDRVTEHVRDRWRPDSLLQPIPKMCLKQAPSYSCNPILTILVHHHADTIQAPSPSAPS